MIAGALIVAALIISMQCFALGAINRLEKLMDPTLAQKFATLEADALALKASNKLLADENAGLKAQLAAASDVTEIGAAIDKIDAEIKPDAPPAPAAV